MDANAKKKYMKSTVLPEMKKLFVAVDKKHYSNMGCQTCHGEKAVENKFKMPNPSLPKLPQPTDRAGFMALQQKKPDIVKFMGTQVKPTMARAAREEGMGTEQPRKASAATTATRRKLPPPRHPRPLRRPPASRALPPRLLAKVGKSIRPTRAFGPRRRTRAHLP